jgi:rare lipoprotein A
VKSSICFLFVVGLLMLLLAGCGGHKQAKAPVPSTPPSISTPPQQSTEVKPGPTKAEPEQGKEVEEAPPEEITIPADAKPLAVETGLASWYGPPYHNRRGSNGEVYNMHAMTAAHRTLPLGSIVRVTNPKTGHSALVRITDRGPFIEGRILDLSLAAAQKIDVWQPGTALVRMEVMKTPVPMETGGRWTVQFGAFEHEKDASKLADRLTRRYHTAKVLRFRSPVGDWWVRVRVLNDDRKRAEEVVRDTKTPEGAVFLVRLD